MLVFQLYGFRMVNSVDFVMALGAHKEVAL